MMPRGIAHTKVRRRQSDAKWRASVAMCYNIMKNVIPNQRKLNRRKISKALTLKETEHHIMNLERVLKELLAEKARMYGKTVMIPKENNILKMATFEDVQSDFADRHILFFSSNACLGKKRYNVPTDIEASLDHLSLQACPLVVLDHCGSQPGAITSSVSPAETEQEKQPYPKKHRPETLLTTPLSQWKKCGPERTQKTSRSGLKTPCKGQHRSETLARPRQDSDTPGRAMTVRREVTPAKRAYVKVDYTTPSKACKQLPFSQSSGFTPIKLPLGLDSGADNSVPSTETTPAKSFFGSTVGSPFSTFSLPQTPNSCFNGVEYFDDDNTSLLCTESIDTLDLEDIPKTPNQVVKDEAGETENSAVKSPSEMTPFRTPSERDPEETETDESLVKNTQERYGDDFGLRKTKSSKCRRRLDRCYQQKVTRREVPDVDKLDSTSEFDGFLLFYNQNAHEIEKCHSSESKAVAMAHMWKSLPLDDRAAYSKIASLENSNNSNYLSDDLKGLDLKPLSKLNHDSDIVGFDLEESIQEVPDLDLSASLLTQSSEEYTLVPEYADLGIIYGLGIEKEITIMPRDELFTDLTDDSQVVPDLVI